jgi:hypothetical protein
MGFILTLIANMLFIILTIVNYPVVMLTHAKKHGFLKVTNQYWFCNALELDKFGNYNFRTFFNICFRKTDGYSFGKKEETISSALGKNQRSKTLTWFGWAWVYILWAIDIRYWKKGGHCINSIED